MVIRSLQRATKIPDTKSPYDTVFMRIYYPAVYNKDATSPADVTGQFQVDDNLAPLPILIFLPEINHEATRYHELAVGLAGYGILMVTTQWVANIGNGDTEIKPGIDALPSILKVIYEENRDPNSILYKRLRENTIVFGGHSTGGSLALINADPAIHENIAGAIAYGALSQRTARKIEEVLPEVPILIMESLDCIESKESTCETFKKVTSNNQQAYLVFLQAGDRLNFKNQSENRTALIHSMVETIAGFILYSIVKIEDNPWFTQSIKDKNIIEIYHRE